MIKWNHELTAEVMSGLLAPEPSGFDRAFDAFEELLSEMYPDIESACRHGIMCKDDAEDCAQDVRMRLTATLISAFNGNVPEGTPLAPLHRLKPEVGLEAWLLGIVVPNEVRNHNRRRQRERARTEYGESAATAIDAAQALDDE